MSVSPHESYLDEADHLAALVGSKALLGVLPLTFEETHVIIDVAMNGSVINPGTVTTPTAFGDPELVKPYHAELSPEELAGVGTTAIELALGDEVVAQPAVDRDKEIFGLKRDQKTYEVAVGSDRGRGDYEAITRHEDWALLTEEAESLKG